MRLGPLAMLGLLIPELGLAQARPQFLPTRDVMVQYAITEAASGAPSGSETWFFSVNAQTFRIEGPRMQGYSLLGARDDSTRGVDHRNRLVVKLEPRPNFGSITDPSSVFTRIGTDVVAGQDCTIWRVAPAIATDPPAGQTICLSAAGVMLRRAFGTQVATATAVTSLDAEQRRPERFSVPAEYRVVTAQPRPAGR